ncbi:MAG: hypothetical protein WBA45_10305 [Microthrixaceae bacterium]
MAKNSDSEKLNFHEKVVAAVDLPGVPAGTPGKVTLVNGFRWTRYRVYFENGVDAGSLDGTQLARRKDWDAGVRLDEAEIAPAASGYLWD